MDMTNIRKLALTNELSINYILKDLEISKIFEKLENKLNIVLKGGTGINRVYLKKEERRFSEDIDFDIYSNKNINVIKAELYEKLKKLLPEYQIEKPRIMNETIRFDIFFQGLQKDKIKLEFKIISKNTNAKTTTKIVDFGFVPHKTTQYLTYILEEFILQKLYAFVNRTDGKDSYDLYFLLQLEYNKNTLNTIIKEFNKENNSDLITQSKNKMTQLLNDKTQLRYLENSINHYIPKSKRQLFSGLLRELNDFIDKI